MPLRSGARSPICVASMVSFFVAAASSLAVVALLSGGSAAAAQLAGSRRSLRVVTAASPGSDGPTQASSCQVQAPLQCRFLYSAQETLLYPGGVLELSTFSEVCEESCLLYLQESPECQAEPDLQRTMLSICQGYHCAQQLTEACGKVEAGELLDHSMACTQQCTAVLGSSDCEGAGEFLPGFAAYEQLMGASSPECLSYECQQRLMPVCPTYDPAARKLLSSDTCLEGCHSMLMGAECLAAGITVVDTSGQYLLTWNPTSSHNVTLGPTAPVCGAPGPAAGASGLTLELSAVFPAISHADLANDPEAKEAFQQYVRAALTEALGAMGIAPGSASVEIVETRASTGASGTSDLTIASEPIGTEVTALLTFASEEDRDLFVDAAASMADHILNAFVDAGLEGEVVDISAPGAEVILVSSSAPEPLGLEQPHTALMYPVGAEVAEADKSLPEDDGGGALPVGGVIGIVLVLVALLAIVAVVVVLKRRRSDDGDASSCEALESERRASSPARGVVSLEREGEISYGASPASTSRSAASSSAITSPAPGDVLDDGLLHEDCRAVADYPDAVEPSGH